MNLPSPSRRHSAPDTRSHECTSHGIGVPCIRHLRTASTPGRSKSPFGQSPPSFRLVPPSWFLTTSTGCSDFAVQVLLQPAADLGVHCVSGCAPPVRGSLERVPSARRGPSPQCVSPLEESPCRQLFPGSPHRPRRVAASHSGHAPLPFRSSARMWILNRLRGLAPSSGLSRLGCCCQRPSRSVLPWVSAPPSILGGPVRCGKPTSHSRSFGANTSSSSRQCGWRCLGRVTMSSAPPASRASPIREWRVGALPTVEGY